MPDTMPNPYGYSSPLGASLSRLGKAIMGGPSEAQQIWLAEKALAAKRENENTVALGDMIQRYGQPGFDRGLSANMAVRAGMNPNNLGGYTRFMAAPGGPDDPNLTNEMLAAGQTYSSTPMGMRETNDMVTARQAATQKAIADRQAASLAAAGQNRPTTVFGTDGRPVVRPFSVASDPSQGYTAPASPQQLIANEALRMSQRPTPQWDAPQGDPTAAPAPMAPGMPSTMPVTQGAPGGLTNLPIEMQRGMGMEPKANPTPRNYVAPTGSRHITYDGLTDASTGQPLPPGGFIANAQGAAADVGLTNKVKGDLQGQAISYNRFDKLLAMTQDVAQRDPTNFGVVGFVKGVLQDAGQLGQNVSQGLGYNGINEAVAGARQRAAAGGVSPQLIMGVFDPNLGQLHTVADLLVFSAAEALAGQQGRSVSDRDVQMFKGIAGDPRDWLMSQEKYTAKLGIMKQVVDAYRSVNDAGLRGGQQPPAPSAAGGTPTPNPPAASPAQVERWERGPNGLQRVQ